jgi:hypothetical protein
MGRTFEANGFEFSVPVACDFRTSSLTADDLIKPDATKADEHSQVADACAAIEALLPRDGDWHSPDHIYTACAKDGINKRTVQRAKTKLGVEHRRTPEFNGATQWRWGSAATLATTSGSPGLLSTASAGTSSVARRGLA